MIAGVRSPARARSRRPRAFPLVAAVAIVAAACLGAPRATTVPSDPGPTASTPPPPETAPTSGQTPAPAGDCGRSDEFQLAYDVPGMAAVEVACDTAYKSINGTPLTLDLYWPPGTVTTDRLPVLVFVHGNGNLADGLRPVREHWKRDGATHGLVAAAMGWAGITFDYRGYGDVDALAAAQDDVLDLLAYVAEHAADLRVDPDWLCLWASSGGGLPAGWASIFGEPRPRCVVAFGTRLDGDVPARDPAAFLDASTPPYFIASGDVDTYARSSRFVEAATAAGVDVVVNVTPGPHGFEQLAAPESRAMIEAAFKFVEAHLGPD